MKINQFIGMSLVKMDLARQIASSNLTFSYLTELARDKGEMWSKISRKVKSSHSGL